jgi:hypothetical protein
MDQDALTLSAVMANNGGGNGTSISNREGVLKMHV